MDDPAKDAVVPDNVHQIRPQMMFVFEANTPIVDPQMKETVECRRYEEGFCRECDNHRGKWTPWCLEHYPWFSGDWREKAE